jgi:hypothetical protein
MVLDKSNNVVVTGSAATVKYDTAGSQIWTAPYAGTSLTVDTDLNIYVVGFSTDFGTVKLSPDGSNLWLTTSPSSLGPNVSQMVALDNNGNVTVAGSSTYSCDRYYCYADLLLIHYDTNGGQLWTAQNLQESYNSVQVEGLVLDNATSTCLIATADYMHNTLFKYGASGTETWEDYPDELFINRQSHGFVLDSRGCVVLTGQVTTNYNYTGYDTIKVDTNGNTIWISRYPPISIGSGISVATSIAVDSANNPYVTGYCPGTNSGNDIVTIKYDQNGNQIWLQRYHGPGNGDDAGNAVAVDKNGNVYVTGYETTAAGGTEIVTIKYSPVTLQRRSDGTVILQAQGSPGESFDIQASTNLLNWLDLGSVLADTNGLMQFDDTNAPAYPARFYYANPQ